MEDIQLQQQQEEEGLDIMALVKRLWSKLVLIARVTLIFMALGLLAALFSQKVFTASTTFVPQTQKSSSSSMSSLAALAGINLNQMGGGNTLSPLIYPQLFENIEFQLELINTPIKFEDWEERVSLLEKATNPKYKKFNLMKTVKKYTVGLPGLILGAIRPAPKPIEVPVSESGKQMISLNEAEYKCINAAFNGILSLELNEKKGYVTITASMGEPVAAAELAQAAYDLMQKYVVNFKINKAQEQMAYINATLAEARADFEKKQMAYAKYQDANRLTSSQVASIEGQKLLSDYTLANTIYTQLMQQQVQTDLQIQEDTPLLSQVKPVSVPFRKSKPSRAKILVVYTFFGFILGCGLVLGFDWLKQQGSEWPKNWKTPEQEASEETVPGMSNPFKKVFWRAVFGKY